MGDKLTDNDIFDFGRVHKGKAMANVPADYLLWFKENVKKTSNTRPIHNYIKENWDSIEIELKRMGKL